jgi:hypothetical protein
MGIKARVNSSQFNVVIGINGVNYVVRDATVHPVAVGAPAVSGPLWLSNLNILNCAVHGCV